MSTDPKDPPQPLPSRPNLRHLKDQARALVRSGSARSHAAALFDVARRYGFASWTKLKAFVDLDDVHGQLADAVDRDDVARVKTLLTADPSLHNAPIGYAGSGALTRVAECRTCRIPTPARLSMAAWMIEHGADIHQHGEAPLGRAALYGSRVPMMELLVTHGADVNGGSPAIFSPCDTVDPVSLRWLLAHGANPNCGRPERGIRDHALDYLLRSYIRTFELSECIDALLHAGGRTRYDEPAVLALLRRHNDNLSAQITAEPILVQRRFAGLDIGVSGERMLTLRGATLLHVAAEFDPTGDAVRLLLDRGADVNGAADVDAAGVGGQTPLFHAVTHGNLSHEWMATIALLIERGADVNVRARVPGHYERADEILECTSLGYARRFSGGENSLVVQTLLKHGARD